MENLKKFLLSAMLLLVCGIAGAQKIEVSGTVMPLRLRAGVDGKMLGAGGGFQVFSVTLEAPDIGRDHRLPHNQHKRPAT